MKKQNKPCTKWVETGSCRFGKNCAYDHPVDGVNNINDFQQKEDEDSNIAKCKPFYYSKYCQFGSMCMFRHEYKKFQQLLRHYYVVKLYCLESLYQYSVDQHSFVNEFETGVQKLPIFEAIHNITHSDSEQDKKSEWSIDYDSSKSLFREIA